MSDDAPGSVSDPAADALSTALAADLAALESAGRRRACPEIAGASTTHPILAGQTVRGFCSNDYLGLASHPALAEAAARAASRSGFGAGAARLVSGNHPEHRALESALASFLGCPAVLLFPTGYQANIGVLTALAGRGDLIVSDAANHASLIDGCRLSRADVAVYPHRDVPAVRALLAAPGAFRRRFLVTESLFSMDGDFAPLADLAEIAAVAQATMIVDEAHALGVFGPSGAGLCRAAGIRPFVTVGTLGKALGTFGGFAAGSRLLVDTLVNRARSFIFTTASPPPLAAAALAGVALVAGSEGDARRRVLQENLILLHDLLGDLPAAPGVSAAPGFPVSSVSPLSPILPIVLGSAPAAVAASQALRDQGLFVQAIRPPTVPEGGSRLRVTLSAAHRRDDIDALARALRPLLMSRP